MKKMKMMIALGATIFWAGAGAATAQQIGVVGLYQNGQSLNNTAISDLGCVVQRNGAIVAMQGMLSPSLTQPDQFIVLACEQSVLENSERRAVLAGLFAGGEPIALFEGALTDFEVPATTPDVAERQYILKLGYYNNIDIDARNAGLTALGAKASQREGHWGNESFLQVHRASGIATPDEVVILYYETAEIGDKFRDSNPDILEEVTAFNAAHLNGFVYLIGAASE
ncbi:MAG: hypothetical protein JKY32_16640 [Rhizobiales bacterium]|nr:hypothetical protein [Hyphomicrobiales bacterium]